ncbi:MAG: site-2 protease family protein [Acidobacteriota bacterium]
MASLADIDIPEVIIGMVVLLFSLSLHESAHAWMADWRGDPTGRYLGRITLNPLPHIDWIGTVVFPLLGMLSQLGIFFGWAKPVPVNTANLRNPRWDHVLVAAAGPVSNVLGAAAFLVGLRLLVGFFPAELRDGHTIAYPLYLLCLNGLFLNTILAVFNLIPVPPLDGSWILAGLLPNQLAGIFDAIRPYSFMLLIALLWSGIFDSVLGPVFNLVTALAS